MNKIKILLFLLIISVSAYSQNILSEIIDGKYNAKQAPLVVFMQNDNYTMLAENGQMIVKYNSANKSIIDTLFQQLRIGAINIEHYEFSSNERKILIRTNTEKRNDGSVYSDYYVYTIAEKRIEKLSENGKQQSATISPNGRNVAFARDNNLYIKRLDYDMELAVTEDGEAGKISNGIPNLAYRQAFNASRMFEWSPDSRLLAFVRYDETDVRKFCLDLYPTLNSNDDFLNYNVSKLCYDYPTAGAKIPKTSVQVYDVFYKVTKEMDIPDTEDIYIPRILWTQKTDQLAIITLNRVQNRLNLLFANGRSTVCTSILVENADNYINTENIKLLQFLPDNQFIFVSERSGFNHIYLYSETGFLKQQITQGEWDITDFYGYNADKKIFYYQSTENSPLERHIFSVQNGRKVLLNKEKGTHNAYFSPNYTYYISDFSSAEIPNQISLRTSAGLIIDTLEDNATLAEQSIDLLPKEFFSFLTADSILLNGWIIKPIDFDSVKKYPVLILSTDNIYVQQIRNEWNVGWEQLLAQNNFIVVRIDPQGTDARGRDFRQSNYTQAGTTEAQNLIELTDYLSELLYIDKNKIGFFGSGLGAQAGLLAMSMSNNFNASIAVAPVIDWRFYSAPFAERIMKRPQENLANYEKSSPLKNAEKLNGKLLLIHGTADEEVNLQNSLMYNKRLMELNKPFEFQLRINGGHSFTSDKWIHLYSKMMEFLKENL